MFYPLLKERIYGRLGDAIDVVAICATLFGLATSLGLGAKQVNAGLHYVFGVPQNIRVQVALIAFITGLAVISLLSGLDAGIRRLSETNMVLAGSLLVFLFVCGPTVYLLGAVTDNIGAYLQRLPSNSFWTATYDSAARSQWLSGWTVFYWAWWIAWCPFVGMFVARVSRGRTIREFITAVLLVPMAVNVLWMTGFGNTALHQELYRTVSADPEMVEATYSYEPKTYQVQVKDEVHGLPVTEDGDWLVAPDAKGASKPHGVLVKDVDGRLVTADGTAIEYELGVMMNAATGDFFDPPVDSLYTGRYQARQENLTLGGYISSPVLTEDRRGTVDTTSTAMFVMLEAYPLSTITALIATLSIVLFFVTSSDSASLVADIIATGGNENPPVGTRLFWGITEGMLAAVLLTAGGLTALQTGTIAVGLPLCILVIVGCFCLYAGLKEEALEPFSENE
jgi:choline-glycine betaine transporter